MKVFLSLIISFWSLVIVASETDNFTTRNIEYQDSTLWLNQKMNMALDQVAAKTKSCNPFELQKVLFQSLGGVFVANIENWSKENPNALFLPIENSIYSEVGQVRGTHGLRKLTKFKAYYTPGQFKVNNVIAGDDKLGHFLQLGYSMYYAVQKKKNSRFIDIRSPMQKLAELIVKDYSFIKNNKEVTHNDIVTAFAQFQEDGEWGMTATLVKSYGDIAADYAGYLFWSELTSGDNPYFECLDNHFSHVRAFNWEEYITPAWDESINCSEFHSSISESVNTQIKKRNIGACPVAPESCADLVREYGSLAKSLLHPSCLKAGKEIIGIKN